MNWLQERDAQRRAAGLHRTLRPRQPGRIDIASNDYLNLARDPEVIEAGVRAMRDWGAGATGSRLVSGHTELHAALESALAELLHAPAVLVFSSGYLANLAAITALTDRDTLLISDARNHASIVDACRLSRAELRITPNADVTAVKQALADNPHPRAVVVTDAVFSVDGELAPLAQLGQVCQEHDALLIIDEAHSVGVLPATPIEGAVRTFTLSKALGSQGGGIAATPAIIDHLVNSARSFIFDTGLAPAATGSALAATRRILADPALPQRALQNTRRLAETAQTAGWTVNPFDAAVAAIPMPSPEFAVTAQAMCAQAGIDVGCFRPPSVPDGIARLRMTGHAGLSDSDFASIEATLRHVKENA
ncbi:MAG: 8-amino-7-oxononanoate synthase [Candidatus Nanopelagicales bacterium]